MEAGRKDFCGQLNACDNIFSTVKDRAMIAFRYFRSKVDHLVNEMEQQALRLVEVIRGERK